MLSKSTEYAIRALIFIQLQNSMDRIPGVPEIASEIEAPQAFSAKILHILTTRKLLNSMKGRGGGFFLAGKQKDITLYDIIIAMQGDGLFTECGMGLKECSNTNPCPLHNQYGVIRKQFSDLARSETVSSLAAKVMNGSAVLNRIMGNGAFRAGN